MSLFDAAIDLNHHRIEDALFDDLWKVRLIDEDFHRLMFETEEG